MRLNSIDITAHKVLNARPKLRLKETCPCTEEFRQKFNAWLLETFGAEKEVAYMIDDPYHGRFLMMSPTAHDALKRYEQLGMLREHRNY